MQIPSDVSPLENGGKGEITDSVAAHCWSVPLTLHHAHRPHVFSE